MSANEIYKMAYRVCIHSVIWVAFFVYENGAILIMAPENLYLKSSALYFLLNAVLFYSNYYLLSVINMDRYKYLKRTLIFLVLCICYLLVNHMLMQYMHAIGMGSYLYIPDTKKFIGTRIIRFMYLITASYTYWLVENKIAAERNLFIIEKQRVIELERITLLEKEKLTSELNYLRLQINPHFIFNTLSFIYAEVLRYSEKAARGVILLSDIMGNVLIEPTERGEIPLSQEITHISNIIEINQLRFNKKLFINYDAPVAGDVDDLKIIPFILVNFVENVFKYANLSDAGNPVDIKLSLSGNQLHFYIHNKKNARKPVSKSTGIGITNVQKRLSLVYPGDYDLNIENQDDFFTVNLNLTLKC
jgi:two-component system LytT family sensor kinase